MTMRLLITWAINAVALMALPYLFSSIQVRSFGTALIVALFLGLLNTLVKPVLVILTLPVTILTLGLFILVINALLFWFVGSFVKGFDVPGFWPAFWGALVYSLVSWATTNLILGNS
jgi:putative membrane protein